MDTLRSAMAEVVQDRCELLHEFTLFDIQARFADVVRLENAVEYLHGRARLASSIPTAA